MTPSLATLPRTHDTRRRPNAARLRQWEAETRDMLDEALTGRERDMYRALAAHLAACAKEVG